MVTVGHEFKMESLESKNIGLLLLATSNTIIVHITCFLSYCDLGIMQNGHNRPVYQARTKASKSNNTNDENSA